MSLFLHNAAQNAMTKERCPAFSASLHFDSMPPVWNTLTVQATAVYAQIDAISRPCVPQLIDLLSFHWGRR
jgi:hypothetical protein